MELGYFQRGEELFRTDVAYRFKEAMELLADSLVKQITAHQVRILLSVEIVDLFACTFVCQLNSLCFKGLKGFKVIAEIKIECLRVTYAHDISQIFPYFEVNIEQVLKITKSKANS